MNLKLEHDTIKSAQRGKKKECPEKATPWRLPPPTEHTQHSSLRVVSVLCRYYQLCRKLEKAALREWLMKEKEPPLVK